MPCAATRWTRPVPPSLSSSPPTMWASTSAWSPRTTAWSPTASSPTPPGYRGWQWAVTVARAPRARVVTIDEIAMLPGSDALVAPAWVPWSQRVEPGDLGVGDVLPTTDDDPRLSPGWSGLDDLAAASDEPGLRPVRMGAGDRPAPGALPRGPRRRDEPLARGRHRSGHPDGALGARVVQHVRVPDADRGPDGVRVRGLRQRDVPGRWPCCRPDLRVRRPFRGRPGTAPVLSHGPARPSVPHPGRAAGAGRDHRCGRTSLTLGPGASG